MATLIIHAPKAMVEQEQKSFESTFASGVGEGYAIPKAIRARLAPGCMVVVLCKDVKPQRRAEGTLVKLVPTNKAGTACKGMTYTSEI